MFGRGRQNGGGARVKRILIVEDEPLVAFDNEHILHEAGYIVVATVDSAADATRLIAAGGIDLVMADVRLRGVADGIDVARAAHAAGVAVMFVTGGCPPDAQRFAIGCLAKPFMGRDLLAAIEVISARLAGTRLPKGPRGFTLFEE
jgi:DNA-binding response OmpR family regulator